MATDVAGAAATTTRAAQNVESRLMPIAGILLFCWALTVWCVLRPSEVLLDWHSVRQADTQTIAINLTNSGASLFWPQVNWGGNGPGYVETELQLYTRTVSWLMLMLGKHEWVGQLVSLLAIMTAACVVFVHLRHRYDEAAALAGFAGFLATRTSPSLASVIMPDAAGLLAYVTAWMLFCQFQKHGTTSHLVGYAAAGTIAMLVKPTLAHLGISSFLFLVLSDRGRLKDVRLWVAWVAMVAVFGVYLWHAHQLYTVYGNTFGLLIGEDSKAPRLRYLLMPQLYLRAARYGLAWGFSALALVLLLIQLVRRRLSAEQVSLAVGNIVIVLIAFRYMSDGAGIHYYAPASLLGASIIAGFVQELLVSRYRTLAVSVLCVLLFVQGASSMRIRYSYSHWPDDQTKEVAAVGKALHTLAQPGELIVVRSTNERFDEFWQQAANYHDPRIFYASGTRGWAIGRTDDDPLVLARCAGQGARFFADPISERRPAIESWLTNHAQLVWSDDSGRIWKLQKGPDSK
jgi:hypothetical protein